MGRDAQHRCAKVHVHAFHRIRQRLILILVNQSDTFRVIHLDHGRGTARYGGGRGDKYRDLRPTLENMDQQIAALHMPVKRTGQIATPAPCHVWDANQPQFVDKSVPPKVPIEQRVEEAVESHARRSIQPPRNREVKSRKECGRHPRQSDRQQRQQERNHPPFAGVCAVAVHTAPARLIRAEQALGPVGSRTPRIPWSARSRQLPVAVPLAQLEYEQSKKGWTTKALNHFSAGRQMAAVGKT
jgi:hypothetical protein